MQIDQHTEISSEEWDAAVGASDDAWLFHTARWIELTASVWKLENRYFVARDNGRLVGGFPIQVARPFGGTWYMPLRWYGRRPWVRPRAYSTKMGSGGPFVVRQLSPKARKRVLSALNQSVLEWAGRRRLAALECVLPPLAANNLNNVRGVNPMVNLGWEDVSTHSRIKDLALCGRRDEEQGAKGEGLGTSFAVPHPSPLIPHPSSLTSHSSLWESISADARRLTERAASQGYTVTREDWRQFLDEYYQVHVETYRRTGVAPHPKAYFQCIAQQIAPAGHAVLWVCHSPTGEPVAFHNCARFGQGALYWTGCSGADHSKAGVNYLLFWNAIRGAAEDGYRFYEVGEAFPNTSDEKLRGLSRFKAKFGGELYRFFRAEVNLSTGRSLRSWFRWWSR